MDKFQNKFRIQSVRLQNWDYGSDAMYFVTICTQGRECYFGNIENKIVILSEIGRIARECWQNIPIHFQFAKLDEFVVMPNHVHGIIVIDKHDDGRNEFDGMGNIQNGGDGGDGGDGRDGRDAINRVSTDTEMETKTAIVGFARDKNPMLNNNLSRIIRWYKGRTTFESRKIHPGFAWQSRYHDHIIRNDAEIQRIKNYIINNPLNWEDNTLKEKKNEFRYR